MRSSGVQAFLSIVACAATAAAAQAADVGSAERGLAIARAQCAECHLLGPEKGQSPKLNAPPFAQIANSPGMTAAALRVALATPHATMPNLIIKDEAADSIIAYILSLKDSQ
jgi:mono/diheme cytochrome c family protein